MSDGPPMSVNPCRACGAAVDTGSLLCSGCQGVIRQEAALPGPSVEQALYLPLLVFGMLVGGVSWVMLYLAMGRGMYATAMLWCFAAAAIIFAGAIYCGWQLRPRSIATPLLLLSVVLLPLAALFLLLLAISG